MEFATLVWLGLDCTYAMIKGNRSTIRIMFSSIKEMKELFLT